MGNYKSTHKMFWIMLLLPMWWTSHEITSYCLMFSLCLSIDIDRTLTLETGMRQAIDVFHDDFDVEIFIFQNNMQAKVIKMNIKHVLQFLKVYDPYKVHHLFTIMFDPCFKSLWTMENYVPNFILILCMMQMK